MAETEDVPYSTPAFATPEPEDEPDEDQPNKSVLLEIQEELEKDIAMHNSFDVLNLPQNATPEEKCAVFDEMFNHKGLVLNLKKYQTMIDKKLKELL